MTSKDTYPLANTRAARMLRAALAAYSKRRAGGLRALSAETGIKPPTVFSHMSSGRMPIPLERASQLANILSMDRTGFCLAVIEQRAPAAFQVLAEELSLDKLALNQSADTKSAVRAVIKFAGPTAELVQLIDNASAVASPSQHWLNNDEMSIVQAIRSVAPSGLTPKDQRFFIDFISGVFWQEINDNRIS